MFDAKGKPASEAMEYAEFLRIAENYGVNFIRLWRWNELTRFNYGSEASLNPNLHPWERTGPGSALDEKPKFNLKLFNQAYFDVLRARVMEAGKRGLYVAVMLFEGHSLRNSSTPWSSHGHPFHPSNNVNGINGDPSGDQRVIETHTLQIPAVNAIQEAYVRKVIDTLNDLDNVLYEIANEDGDYSVKWQYHLIKLIHQYEATKPQRHLVGMTCLGVDDLSPAESIVNPALWASPADWISPFTRAAAPYNYSDNPPPSDGQKLIISDTDHLFGKAADYTWAWKSFMRGLNVNNYMELRDLRDSNPRLEKARRAMGHTRAYAERMNLAAMSPQPKLASTRYCLAHSGSEYLVYQPRAGESFSVDVNPGTYHFEWFNPATGEVTASSTLQIGTGEQTFKAPFAGDAVLYLRTKPPPLERKSGK